MSIFNFFFKKKEQPKGVIRVYSGRVVAKRLLYESVDTEMYEDQENRIDCCPICHNTLRKIPNENAKIPLKRWDIAVTDDGYVVVSEKFRLFCSNNHYNNLTFVPLPKSKGVYFFEPQGIFPLDYELYRTKFYNKRECCGSYDEVCGPPVVRSRHYSDNNNNDFIMKAEYYFASFDKKNPDLIFGTETVNKMKTAGLKGINYFEDIYDFEGLSITSKITNKNVLD